MMILGLIERIVGLFRVGFRLNRWLLLLLLRVVLVVCSGCFEWFWLVFPVRCGIFRCFLCLGLGMIECWRRG